MQEYVHKEQDVVSLGRFHHRLDAMQYDGTNLPPMCWMA